MGHLKEFLPIWYITVYQPCRCQAEMITLSLAMKTLAALFPIFLVKQLLKGAT